MSEKKRPGKEASPKHSNSGPMDIALLERIVKLMQAYDLNTVDLRDGQRRVMMRRGPVQAPAVAMSIPVPIGAAPAASAVLPAAPADETTGWIPIKSPMVGTFYSAPSPDAKAFVTLGSPVTEETDVCVIEAMKVFNNVKAECRGTIAKILASNGNAVEFGQVLFLVKP